jgi:hypothetical protein
MKIDPPPPRTAEAATFAHERGVLKQGRFNGKNGVARHIAGGVQPFENKKLDALSGGWRGVAHEPDSRGRRAPSNAKVESIEANRFDSLMIDAFELADAAVQRPDDRTLAISPF